VRFGLHRAMLRPRDSHDLKLRSTKLTVSPAAKVRWVHDVFGNSITLLEFAEDAAELRVESRIELEHYPVERLDYAIAAEAERWPFAYNAEDRLDLGPTLDRHYPDGEGRVRGWALDLLGRHDMGTAELLTTVTHGIKEQLRYAVRHDEGTQTPLETLERGSGSCRDYALLMMEVVRSLGFAARFVTGYLYDPAVDGGAAGVQGAGSTHAWLQVYLPGAGWIEYDPTNGIYAGVDHIVVAYGRDYGDVAPVRGIVRTAGSQTSAQSVDVIPVG
jgi:transglutaminase-like putative cysteine protease